MKFFIIHERKHRNMNDFLFINGWILLVLAVFFQLHSSFCWCLNDEGLALLKFKGRVVNDPFGALSNWDEKNGENNPCTWFGIQCVDGHVVSLNLENLCLEGTLAPELQHLLHIKSILLRNNSFYGGITFDNTDLKDLELVDLSYNNFRTSPSNNFGFNTPLLLLNHNGLSCHLSRNSENSEKFFEALLPSTRQNDHQKHGQHVRMLAGTPVDSHPPESSSSSNHGKGLNTPSPPVAAAPSAPPKTPATGTPVPPTPPPAPPAAPPTPPAPPTKPTAEPTKQHETPPPPPPPPPPQSPQKSTSKKGIIIAAGVGGGIVLVLGIGLCLWGGNVVRKNVSKGLSGQLQKAFVSGIQNLKRSELEAACEDFSNVIGTCSIGTIYKGTLSNGVEIAVITLAASSAKDWPKSLQTQFRKKLETLSKVSHKNFVSLIGYCKEAQPFTRMMVFEYAPNGSLFEHLHVREAEHLDWKMRLRVAMGMAYCLEHMHQLAPPITHPNLNSSSVHLSDDYAAKISDFTFWNEVAAAQVQPVSVTNLCVSTATPESNVYSFGLVLLEMVTGRIPHTMENNNTVEDWVSEFMSAVSSLAEMVDPMLRRHNPEQLEKVSELIRKCLHSDPKLRLTMKDIAAKLKDITTLDKDKAGPRLSPLWWSELEGRSTISGSTTGGET